MNQASHTGLIVALVTAAGVLALDLATKRWAERHLATPRHLLPIPAPGEPAGKTAGEVVRDHFPDRTDSLLRGALHRLPPAVPLDPEEPVFEIERRHGLEPVVGFFVPDRLESPRFFRRLNRDEGFRMQRDLLRQRPDLPQDEVRRQVQAALGGLSVAGYLLRRLPHLSRNEAEELARQGLFPIPPGDASEDPARAAEAGQTWLLADREVVLIPGLLDFSYAENPAGAFSLLHNLDEDLRRVLFFVLSVVGLVAIGWLLRHPPAPGWWPMLALGGILGGALGNLVDRVLLAYVVDFIHMYWKDWHWPRYNVADIGITVGVVMLLLGSSFGSHRKSPAGEPPTR